MPQEHLHLREGTLDQNLVTTGFAVQQPVVGTQIDFLFNTMPGNQPSTYGNAIFIWQAPNPTIPRNTSPLNTYKPQVNTPDGSGTFPNLNVTSLSYLLGYAVGPAVTNICATVFVPATSGDQKIISTAPVIATLNIGPTSVSYSYSMPGGSQPQNDGDWVGLWRGQEPASLYSLPPNWFAPLSANDSQGYGALNNVLIDRGLTYTLGYFKGGYDLATPKQIALACALTFRG